MSLDIRWIQKSTELIIDSLSKTCDSCNHSLLILGGKPVGTRVGASIGWCSRCGLFQSTYGFAKQARHSPSISSDANWGNIRHGKGVRIAALDSYLRQIVSVAENIRILDVGSNRGDFCRWATEHNPTAEIVAIEPDESVVSDYSSLANIQLIVGRLESVNPETLGKFDFISNIHTLEHASSAISMLKTCHSLLSDNGYLLIEVPNIEIIRAADIVEEFFIDKHSFHFDMNSLSEILINSGFTFQFLKSSDSLNLTVVCRKKGYFVAQELPTSLTLYQNNFSAVEPSDYLSYRERLVVNREKLVHLADRLNKLAERQSVAIWGATRLFDSLVMYGKLDATAVTVIDDFLVEKISSCHGALIYCSEILKSTPADVLVILARSSEAVIRQRAKELGCRNVYSFHELFADC